MMRMASQAIASGNPSSLLCSDGVPFVTRLNLDR